MLDLVRATGKKWKAVVGSNEVGGTFPERSVVKLGVAVMMALAVHAAAFSVVMLSCERGLAADLSSKFHAPCVLVASMVDAWTDDKIGAELGVS